MGINEQYLKPATEIQVWNDVSEITRVSFLQNYIAVGEWIQRTDANLDFDAWEYKSSCGTYRCMAGWMSFLTLASGHSTAQRESRLYHLKNYCMVNYFYDFLVLYGMGKRGAMVDRLKLAKDLLQKELNND